MVSTPALDWHVQKRWLLAKVSKAVSSEHWFLVLVTGMLVSLLLGLRISVLQENIIEEYLKDQHRAVVLPFLVKEVHRGFLEQGRQFFFSGNWKRSGLSSAYEDSSYDMFNHIKILKTHL